MGVCVYRALDFEPFYVQGWVKAAAPGFLHACGLLHQVLALEGVDLLCRDKVRMTQHSRHAWLWLESLLLCPN